MRRWASLPSCAICWSEQSSTHHGVLVRDGGVIASGYNEELDEWRALADGATDYLERLEVRERERTLPTR